MIGVLAANMRVSKGSCNDRRTHRIAVPMHAHHLPQFPAICTPTETRFAPSPRSSITSASTLAFLFGFIQSGKGGIIDSFSLSQSVCFAIAVVFRFGFLFGLFRIAEVFLVGGVRSIIE